MTQEEKELLLKYTCMALPYDVLVAPYILKCTDATGMVDYESNIYILNEIDPACKDIDYITVRIQDVERLMCAKSVMIENIKPYLRPMSSMTEEEKKEISNLLNYEFYVDTDYALSAEDGRHRVGLDLIQIYINWLLEHHFDFIGLIPKDLAIEVTNENNPYK